MSALDECGMLVNELREDAGFVDSLSQLRNAITAALMASHPTDRKATYASVAERLVEVIDRLEMSR